MNVSYVTRWSRFWNKNGRHGVEIEMESFGLRSFFISDKQYKNLEISSNNNSRSTSDNLIFVVFENERYVWSARLTPYFSDLPLLVERFSVDLESIGKPDPHFEELENPTVVEHDDLKN